MKTYILSNERSIRFAERSTFNNIFVIRFRIMTENKTGLIINVSSGGGLRYLFNVAYGVGKAACDRMAADCAMELKKHNVAMVSLWPGAVKTEKVQDMVLGSY